MAHSEIIFCEVGNSSFAFYDGQNIFRVKKLEEALKIKKTIYFICVNDRVINVLKTQDHWINLEPFFSDFATDFIGLGVDRKAVCQTLQSGIIVDAGSAITIDIVKNNIYKGGLIYPGVYSFKQAFLQISQRLDYDFNYHFNIDTPAKNTQNSITKGFLHPLFYSIKNFQDSYGIDDVFVCGGDAVNLKTVFKDWISRDTLVFEGMQKIYRKNAALLRG